MWKIEKIVSKGDYNYAVVKQHPNATKHGYVLEHRVVMENYLKRLLGPNEVVHHINGDKKDNRIENLEVMTASDHAKMHGREIPRKMVKLKCPWCGDIFIRYHNKTFLAKGGSYSACSRSCSGKFSRHIQLYGKTASVEQAISGNIVRVFASHDDPEEIEDNRDP